MHAGLLVQPLSGLLVAAAVGLMVGVQREQAHADEGTEPFGVRTFTLCAALGNLSWLLGPWLFALAFAACTALVLAGYRRSAAGDAGLTTEAALLVCVTLGALAATRPALAAGAGVGSALLLAVKQDIHHFARRVLSPREVRDALLLLAAVLVVLPLLPDRALGPYSALNLRTLWSMVVLVLAINAAGYVALRALGPRRGLLFAGFSGGFVSSTATIAALSRMAAAQPAWRGACRAGAMVSNAATVLELALLIGVLAPALCWRLAPVLTLMLLLTLLLSVWLGWRRPAPEREAAPTLALRPFRFLQALVFAAIIAGARLAAAAVQAAGLAHGPLWVALAAGFADVHATSIAVLQGHGGTGHGAAAALVLAFASNSLSKAVMAVLGGGWRFAWPLLAALAALSGLFALALLRV